MESIEKRIESTEKQIKKYFDNSMRIMISKNRQRGDCWRMSGLKAQVIEIHSMYFRLRNLVLEMEAPGKNSDGWNEWADQIQNALEDMRNFTILAELCLLEKNLIGEDYAGNLRKI
jgi:hypothetical protein